MKNSNEYNFNLEASSYIPKNQRGTNIQNENAVILKFYEYSKNSSNEIFLYFFLNFRIIPSIKLEISKMIITLIKIIKIFKITIINQ